MIPVIKTLSATTGADLAVLSWTLAMGTDIGGSATPIGASANVVGTSIASREGYPVTWGKYCKVAVPATVIVILISMVSIYVRYLQYTEKYVSDILTPKACFRCKAEE